MNTTTLITKKLVLTRTALAMGLGVTLIGLFASGCSTTTGAPSRAYGGISSKPWLRFEPIRGVEDIERLQPGDEIAMVCSKCKNVEVTRVVSLDSKGRQKTVTTSTEHQCPGCGAKFEVGPDKQTRIVHICSKCGDTSAFCCVTKKGASPTKGMEKEKK